ncbi:MAG: hypothetical protein Q7T70_02745 [Polaromonas sp.]|nr:hypothetical protein [Polaromonas sp.]
MQTNTSAAGIIAAARAARQALEWAHAAHLFTHAADILAAEDNPHGRASAGELGVRRDAHLCLCRTPEFVKHRERRSSWIYVDEWREPSGGLVAWLLPRATEPLVHLRNRVSVC